MKTRLAQPAGWGNISRIIVRQRNIPNRSCWRWKCERRQRQLALRSGCRHIWVTAAAHLVTSVNPVTVLEYKVILPQAQLGHSSHLFSHMPSQRWPVRAKESLRCELEAWNATQDEMFTWTVFPFFSLTVCWAVVREGQGSWQLGFTGVKLVL